jgi:GNAT superfamily N-acetyltransferase
MIKIEAVNRQNRKLVGEFIELPYRIYQGVPQWVPFMKVDVRNMLDPKKHPFYEHSDAQAFIAVRNGQTVGRIAVMENRLYNQVQNKEIASFDLLESENDLEVIKALFGAAREWATNRGLTQMIGPKPFGLGDGYGILVEGFEKRQMMIMMNYNLPYLPRLMEEYGFEKEVDFVSCQIETANFSMPEKVKKVAERVLEKGTISVRGFTTRSELRTVGKEIGEIYNKVFVKNWEYYPYTKREIETAIENVILFADPKMIKVLMDGEKIIGFLFAFPDVSRAIQRHKGQLNPISILDLLREANRSEMVSVNGMGVMEEYHGRGGNALLYYEMEKTVKSRHFKYAEFTQVAESAQQMRKDLITLGGAEVKNHRVYRLDI